MEEKVVEELRLKREIDQMRKEIEQLQAKIDICSCLALLLCT